MKIKVNKNRFETAKKAQSIILANAIHHEVLLLKARHTADEEAISQLTETCEELNLIAELLDSELTRLQSIYQVNLN